MKLNLGAGETKIEGFRNVDRKGGQEVYPLAFKDGTVDEIRASHVLEHFSHRQVGAVLADWVRALKPGGLLRVAVPDFEVISRAYLAGAEFPVEGYVMGGHVDGNDVHGALFDRETLFDALRAVGLLGVTEWRSEVQDCAALPISLNLQGRKPYAKLPSVRAVMSVPRLGFMDNFFCAFEALAKMQIGLRKCTGAFWGQCLTRAIEETLETEDPEWILTIDYDSVYTRNDIEALLALAVEHPEADAIAPLQVSRSKAGPLMTVRGGDGKNTAHIARDDLQVDLLPARTAHFGLTLIRASALRELPRPWFVGEPDEDGGWGDARTDDDIYFWRQWEDAGRSLYIANRVPIGHAELMVRWPDRDLTATYQHPTEFWTSGKPEDIWR